MTLALRPPEFGNTFQFTPNTLFSRVLNGTLLTFQGNRPTWQGFHVTFTALSLDQINRFRIYMIANRGQIITLTDFENRVWTGIISSKEIEILSGMNTCNYQASFEFEGNVT